jgi:hypothetical protein
MAKTADVSGAYPAHPPGDGIAQWLASSKMRVTKGSSSVAGTPTIAA